MAKKHATKYPMINKWHLLEFHLAMFEYNNLPKTIKPEYLEYYTQADGYSAITKDANGDLIATRAALIPPLDVYGQGTKVICTTANGQQYTRDIDADAVIMFNNNSHTPCGDIWTDAERISDVDTSLDYIIFWTRVSPMLQVADEKTREKVETAFKNMAKGYPLTIVSKRLLADAGLDTAIEATDLTRTDLIDKTQYVEHVREDLLRWHFTKYGQAVQSNSKMAQQSVDEVNGTTSTSMILPLEMLKRRQEAVEMVNTIFDTDISVKLSGAWRAEVTKYEEATGEGDIDGTEEEEPQTEPEKEEEVKENDD